MNLDRFQTLAEAFGGSIARWPGVEQDAAYALLAADPEGAARALAEARDLDEVLDAAERLSPSHDLRQRVLDAAPRVRVARMAFRRWLTGAGVGIGLAAATAAGLAIGVNVSLAAAGEDALLMATAYSSGLAVDGDVS